MKCAGARRRANPSATVWRRCVLVWARVKQPLLNGLASITALCGRFFSSTTDFIQGDLMKHAFIPALMMLMLASLACEFSSLMPTPPPLPTRVPSETPTITPSPLPTQTQTPTITPTPPLAASDGPALLKLHMSDQKAGWGLIDNAVLSTRDGGLSWASVPLPGVTVDSSVGSFFYTADIAYFVVPVPNSHLGQFFATREGGQFPSWQINPVPFSTGELYFVDDNVGFVFQTLSQTTDIMTNAIYQTL